MHFEIDEILPMRHPVAQELGIICFHYLIAALQLGIHPTGYIRKAFWCEPSVISKSAVNRNSVTVPEVFNNHV